jgi:hypothetical protein
MLIDFTGGDSFAVARCNGAVSLPNRFYQFPPGGIGFCLSLLSLGGDVDSSHVEAPSPGG